MQILTDIKGEIDNNTVRAGGFNIPLTSMYRSPERKSVRKLSLNDTLNKLDFADLQSTAFQIHFHSKYTWNILQDKTHARPQNKS